MLNKFTTMQTRSIVAFLLFLLSRTDASHLRGNALTDPAPRIIGGRDVTNLQRYPYFTKLSGNDGLCGGALIAPDVVISSAFVSKNERQL